MKKGNLFLLGMLAVLLTFGLVLIGCDDGGNNGPSPTPTPTPTTGTIRITNQSEYNIINVMVTDAEIGAEVVFDSGIKIDKRGGSKTYTVDAPAKYIVAVEDESENYNYSTMFTLQAGSSKSITWNGTLLY